MQAIWAEPVVNDILRERHELARRERRANHARRTRPSRRRLPGWGGGLHAPGRPPLWNAQRRSTAAPVRGGISLAAPVIAAKLKRLTTD